MSIPYMPHAYLDHICELIQLLLTDWWYSRRRGRDAYMLANFGSHTAGRFTLLVLPNNSVWQYAVLHIDDCSFVEQAFEEVDVL